MDKSEQLKQLVRMGKTRGFVLYDEIDDLLPPQVMRAEPSLRLSSRSLRGTASKFLKDLVSDAKSGRQIPS